MRSDTSNHLIAFSQLLARDPEIARLNTRDLQILAAVVEHGRPLSQSALCAILSLDPSVVCRTAARLELSGFLTRKRSISTDARLSILVPTEQGISANRRIKRYYDDSAVRPRVSAA